MQRFLTTGLLILLALTLSACGYQLRANLKMMESLQWSFDKSVDYDLRQFIYASTSNTSNTDGELGHSDRVHLENVVYTSRVVRVPSALSTRGSSQLEFRADYAFYRDGEEILSGSLWEIGHYSDEISRPYASGSGYEFTQRNLWRQGLEKIHNQLHLALASPLSPQ